MDTKNRAEFKAANDTHSVQNAKVLSKISSDLSQDHGDSVRARASAKAPKEAAQLARDRKTLRAARKRLTIVEKQPMDLNKEEVSRYINTTSSDSQIASPSHLSHMKKLMEEQGWITSQHLEVKSVTSNNLNAALYLHDFSTAIDQEFQANWFMPGPLDSGYNSWHASTSSWDPMALSHHKTSNSEKLATLPLQEVMKLEYEAMLGKPTAQSETTHDMQDGSDLQDDSSTYSTNSLDGSSSITDDGYSPDISTYESHTPGLTITQCISRWIFFIINRYNAAFNKILDFNSSECVTSCANSQESAKLQSFSGVALGEKQICTDSTRKRNRKEPSDDNDDGKIPRKRPRIEPNHAESSQISLLACFFHKREPWNFCKNVNNKYKSCPLGFPNLHRLKEHCKRRHISPIHCTRCKVEFKNDEDLEEHRDKMIAGCQVNSENPFTGITEKQKREWEAKTKQRKPEAEKWKIMYEIIFPGELAPSPFVQIFDKESPLGQEMANWVESYHANDLPRLIEESPGHEVKHTKVWLNAKIKAIAHDFITKFHAQWQQQRSAQHHVLGITGATSPTEKLNLMYDGISMSLRDAQAMKTPEPTSLDLTSSSSPKTPLQDFGLGQPRTPLNYLAANTGQPEKLDQFNCYSASQAHSNAFLRKNLSIADEPMIEPASSSYPISLNEGLFDPERFATSDHCSFTKPALYGQRGSHEDEAFNEWLKELLSEDLFPCE